MSDTVIDVVENENTPENITVSKAWVFHDNIFVVKTIDNMIYTSVEASYEQDLIAHGKKIGRDIVDQLG